MTWFLLAVGIIVLALGIGRLLWTRFVDNGKW